MSAHYRSRVLTRAMKLVGERHDRLPNEPFKVRGRWEGKHRTAVIIDIIGSAKAHWVCDEEWTEIVNLLNQEFENDRQYHGIRLEIPADWADGFGDHFEQIELGSRLRVRRNDHD